MCSTAPPNTVSSIGPPAPPPIVGEAVTYLLLDSFQKSVASSMSTGVLSWSLSTTTANQSVSVSEDIINVIEFRIKPFILCMPPEESYNITTTSTYVSTQNNSSTNTNLPLLPVKEYPMYRCAPWIYNPLSQVPCGGRFTIFISEFSRQAFSPVSTAPFQFELACRPLPWSMQFVEAVPLNKKYVFSATISSLQTLTLNFSTLTHSMAFKQDVYPSVPVGTDPNGYMRFTIPAHDLYQGDRIVVTGFSCGTYEIDAVVTTPGGLVVADDPAQATKPPAGRPIPGVYFWTDPAIKPVAPFAIACTVYVLKRRIRIPCAIRQVRFKNTNYKLLA